MKKILLFLGFALCHLSWAQTAIDGWPIFAKVKFTATLMKELNEYFLIPTFEPKIKSLIGSDITLKGYYMSLDMPARQLIISKNPYSSCFFCGAAGPESVAEVILKTKLPKLRTDQVITVKGKLKLNAKDVNHMNFILTEAEIIPN
jgi:hypothetical protein